MESLHKPSDENDHGIPMHIVKQGYEEDKYGYVETSGYGDSHSETLNPGRKKKPSSQLMRQLPSRNLDDLIGNTTATDSYVKHTKSLHHKDSDAVYKTMRLKSAAINCSHLKIPPEQVYELLTADDTMSPDDMKNTLREMHQSLTLKREIKAHFIRENEVRKQREHLNWTKSMKYKIKLAGQRLKYDIQDLKYSLELWHGHIKAIQGHFGSGVASYFIFLRWLVYINAFSSVLISLFIILPQWMYGSNEQSVSYLGNKSITAFNGYDLLTGSGWLSDSIMYYGHYTNETIEVVSGVYYNMPLAYIFTIGISTIVTLVILAYSVAKSYQRHYVNTSGRKKNIFADKIFCAWDYSIETTDAAHLHSRGIYNDMKEILSSELKVVMDDTCGMKVLKWVVFIGVHVFVLSILAGTAYLVNFILKQASFMDAPGMMQMTLALSVTAIAFVFYQILKLITRIEQSYSKTTGVYRTMIRVVGLKIAILGSLLYFWFIIDIPQASDFNCFETHTGEEIYRLIIVNFICTLLFATIIGEYFRKVVFTHLSKCVGSPEFDVAYNTLDLMYYQTLVWVGSYFNPLLPLILLVIYIVLFYEKCYSISINCQPSTKPWNATHAHTIFLCLAFLNFLLAAVAVGYAILLITPSISCGPFRHHKKNYDIIKKIIHLGRLDSLFIMEVVEYVTSPGVMAAILTALCVTVYYLRAQAKGYSKMVNLIHEQLILEGKDKVFLLRLFDKALRKKKEDAKVGTSGFVMKKDNRTSDNNKDDIGGSRSELVNEVYKDYHPMQLANYSSKFNPGYMPAAVPMNEMTPDYSDSDDENHKHSQNCSNLTYSNSASCSDVTGERYKNRLVSCPPRRQLHSDSSPIFAHGGLPSPSHKAAQRYEAFLPIPVHQQGFQYLARGETPPRLNKSSDGSIASGKRKK